MLASAPAAIWPRVSEAAAPEAAVADSGAAGAAAISPVSASPVSAPSAGAAAASASPVDTGAGGADAAPAVVFAGAAPQDTAKTATVRSVAAVLARRRVLRRTEAGAAPELWPVSVSVPGRALKRPGTRTSSLVRRCVEMPESLRPTGSKRRQSRRPGRSRCCRRIRPCLRIRSGRRLQA